MITMHSSKRKNEKVTRKSLMNKTNINDYLSKTTGFIHQKWEMFLRNRLWKSMWFWLKHYVNLCNAVKFDSDWFSYSKHQLFKNSSAFLFLWKAYPNSICMNHHFWVKIRDFIVDQKKLSSFHIVLLSLRTWHFNKPVSASILYWQHHAGICN